MKTSTTSILFLILIFPGLQQVALGCSWDFSNFCITAQAYESDTTTNSTIVSGVVVNSDIHGVDLEVLEVLGGVESRSIIRIWDGIDFDCNGIHSMAAGDFFNLGDSLVIILPIIETIQNGWDKIGDYRMPMPYGALPYLRVNNGILQGFILGNYKDDHVITELPYDYFVRAFKEGVICQIELPNLVVRFFHDENQNGRINSTESYLPIGSIEIPSIGHFENFKSTGIFTYAPEELVTVNFDPDFTPDWKTTSGDTYEVDLEQWSKEIRIGLTPTNFYNNVVYNFTNPNFRCGEDIPFSLIVTNEGTESASGTFFLSLDSRLENVVFDEEPDFSDAVNGIYGWNYEDLGPYENYLIPLTVTAPLITDPSQVGEIYTFKITEDNTGSREIHCHDVELRCSYDPNDKQSTPLRDDNLALISAPLTYTIRFQNTGNDYARDVVVTDTLDSWFDLSTFKFISTSHPRNLMITSTGGYDKRFEFKNIFLPDSISDEPNSHGFITFEISAKQDLPLDTQLDNVASIYFDFNPAIVTNTESRIMVESFPTSNTFDISSLDVEFFPNPAFENLTFNREIAELRIHDIAGKVVKSRSQVSQLSIAELEVGIYQMILSDGKKSAVRTLVVTR